MVDRRQFLAAGGAALAALPATRLAAALSPLPAIPPGGRLAFAVMRNGSLLGNHVVTFQPSSDALMVHIAVDLAFKLGPITLFHYRHRGSERWVGGQIMGFESTTNDNGTAYQVKGQRVAEGLAVEGTSTSRYIAPAEALPGNHWNRAMLGGPFINTQDGRLMHPRVAALGLEQIPTASGSGGASRQ